MVSRHLILIAAWLVIACLTLCTAQDAAVCDCTDECTKMADARALELETTWMQRVETLEASAQQERKQHNTEIQTLELVLQEANQNAEASLERANSLRKEHEESLTLLQEQVSRDKAFCMKAQEEVVSLKAQVDKLSLAEKQVDDLKRQVNLLNKEKQELGNKQETLTRDLQDSKHKLRNVNDKYLESSRGLLKANDQYRELYNEYSTTYINFKVIQDDFMATAHKIRDKLVKFWNEKLAPYWNKIAKPLAPWIKYIAGILVPMIQSTITLMVDVFYQQVVPFWQKHIYPHLEPTLQPLFVKHDDMLGNLSAVIQQKCHSLYSYVKLLEGQGENGKIRAALLDALQYGDEHSDKVARILENMVLLFIGYWIVVGLIALQRHRKGKRAQDQLLGTSSDGGLVYPNHTRKKNQ